MPHMELERYLRELSERQHGVFGRRQLWTGGFGNSGLLSLERRGTIQHLSPEVMRLAGSPYTPLSRAMAAVLDAPTGAILSHASAAALWDVPGFSLRGGLHVTIPRQGIRTRGRLSVIHYHQDLPLSETVLHRGIPTASPTFLAFQLAASEHPARAERGFDFLMSRHLTTSERLDGLVQRIGGRGRNGTRVARDLVRRSNDQPLPDSGLERRVEWLAGQGGVKLRRQVSLGGTEFVGRVDFELVERAGVIEAQSIAYHASPLNAESDRERFDRLIAMGLSVMTIWDYQAFQHGGHVIDQIQHFARRLDAGHPPHHFECPNP